MLQFSWIHEIYSSLTYPTNYQLIAFLVVIPIYVNFRFFNFPLKKNDNISTVPGFPIIGNLMTFIPSNKVFRNIDACINKYGSILELWIFNHRIVVVADITVAKEVMMKRPKIFCRTRSMLTPAKLFGWGTKSGLFFTEGEAWSQQRRLTSPSFSHKNIELMSNSIGEQIDEFLLRLTFFADGKTVVEMDEQVFYYTISVISSVAFGEMSKENQDYFFSPLLIIDLRSIFQFLLSRTLFPLPSFFWHFSPDNREVNANKAGIRFEKYCMSMISEKKTAMTTALPSSTHRTCLLDKLISNKSEGGSPMTDHDILSNVQNFFLAGSDTTSVTISWCLYHICLDKVLQKTMQKEVDEVLALDVTGAEAIAAIPHLPLCSACFKETLRLKSPADALILETVEKAVTLSNGVKIRSGDEVFVNLSMLMLDPKVFPEPQEFRPSRWLKTSNTPEKLAEMNDSFTVFGGGPRVCPGQALTYSEGISALAALTRNFDMKLGCPEGEIERVCEFVTKPNKMPLILTKRI